MPVETVQWPEQVEEEPREIEVVDFGVKPEVPKPKISPLAQLEYEGLPYEPEARKKEELRRMAMGETAMAPAFFPLPLPIPGMMGGIGPPAPELTMEAVKAGAIAQVGGGTARQVLEESIPEFTEAITKGYLPTAIGQAGKALGLGILGFADRVVSQVGEVIQQLASRGEVDLSVVQALGEAKQAMWHYEPTDPAAQLAVKFVGAIPLGVKTAFNVLADEFKNSPNIEAGLRTAGDMAELAAFGKVFHTLGIPLKPKEAVRVPGVREVKAADRVIKRDLKREREAERITKAEEAERPPVRPKVKEVPPAEEPVTIEDVFAEKVVPEVKPEVKPTIEDKIGKIEEAARIEKEEIRKEYEQAKKALVEEKETPVRDSRGGIVPEEVPPTEPIALERLNESPELYKGVLDNREIHPKEVVTRAEEIGGRVLAEIKQEGEIIRRYGKKESVRSISRRYEIAEDEVISILDEAEALGKVKPLTLEIVRDRYRRELKKVQEIKLSPEEARPVVIAAHERLADTFSDRTRFEPTGTAEGMEIAAFLDDMRGKIEPPRRTAADVDASEAQTMEVARAADEVRGAPDVMVEFGGYEAFRRMWKRSERGKEIERTVKEEYGTTENSMEALYMARDGRYIKDPGTVHGNVDMRFFGREGREVGSVAREAGLLEIVDMGKEQAFVVRAFTRLSDAQAAELRRVSRTRDSMYLDIYDARGTPKMSYNKESLHRFIADAKPTEAAVLEFGGYEGFGKMYRDFVGKTKERGAKAKKPLSTEAIDILDRGEIVKHRKFHGRFRPPIFRAELEVFKGLKKLDQVLTHRAFENPFRTFEEAGGDALLDMTIHPYHAREFAIGRMVKAAKRSLGELRKEVGPKSRRRIMIYAVSKQKRGMKLLEYRGIKEIPELTPKEMNVYNALRERYKSWYTRLNRVRKAIGKEPFPEEKDYFTFIRTLSVMEEIGFKPMHTRAATFASQYVKAGATAFRFAKRRVGGKYKLNLDPFEVLDMYESQAIRHIQLSPLIAKLRELQTAIIDPATKGTFLLSKANPVFATSLHSWTNHIAGLKSTGFELPPFFERTMLRINSNLTAAILGANLRSAMIQVSALRNTVAEVGFGYTLRGIGSLINPRARNLAMRKSKVLAGRRYDVTVEDALRAVRSRRLGELQRVGARTALKPLQLLDIETAKACWHAAYKHGMEKLGYKSKKAITYADDVVTRTQASAMPGDIAPIQRAVAGRFLTLFQTFTINDWNFLIRDVLGLRNATVDTPGAFAKAMRYVAATTLFNILFEDVLHIQSPFPTPIRAFRESLERGDDTPSLLWNVGKEFIEPIPIIGAARYGKGPGGPGVELLNETVKYITKKPMAQPAWEIGGKWIGLPGVAQVAKTVRAEKRGETPYGRVVGTYTPPEERPGKAVRRGRGMRTKRRGMRGAI